MQMLSRKGLNSADLDTVRVSSNPTTVITANGVVQMNEESDSVRLRSRIVRDSTHPRGHAHRAENSAKNTDIAMSWPVVKNYI